MSHNYLCQGVEALPLRQPKENLHGTAERGGARDRGGYALGSQFEQVEEAPDWSRLQPGKDREDHNFLKGTSVAYYRDLREYLQTLESKDQLIRINQPINKDTELMPLVRWQFLGLPPQQRRAFLFDHVVDGQGRRYETAVAVGILGGSEEIYALALGCQVAEISQVWEKAQRFPIPPVLVKEGPVKEVIYRGQEVEEAGGMELFPVPISTPGFDPAPYLTSPYWVTKDPETGSINVGTYRGMLKGRGRIGVMAARTQHMGIHLEKARKMGVPLPAAVVIGCVPAVGICSISKIPYGVNEFAVAGGLAGEAIELLPCETVDLEVPATAEIVLEGEIHTDYLEPEAPFGEFTGYMGERTMAHLFTIRCITHRRAPIYHAFLSQCPPSEASVISKISLDANYTKFLKYDCNIPGVIRAAVHRRGYVVIQMKKRNQSEPWQALNGAAALDPSIGKIIIAVDEDINPDDFDAVNWALCFRMQPHRDTRITRGKAAGLDPSAAPPGTPADAEGTSAMLIDATRKWDYPPVSLPKRAFMERARKIWEEAGLPPLQQPRLWHGYSLGHWPEEYEVEADLAVQGRYRETAEKLAAQGRYLPGKAKGG